jgi:hypothetical protein
MREDDGGARLATVRQIEQRFEVARGPGQIMNGWHE